MTPCFQTPRGRGCLRCHHGVHPIPPHLSAFDASSHPYRRNSSSLARHSNIPQTARLPLVVPCPQTHQPNILPTTRCQQYTWFPPNTSNRLLSDQAGARCAGGEWTGGLPRATAWLWWPLTHLHHCSTAAAGMGRRRPSARALAALLVVGVAIGRLAAAAHAAAHQTHSTDRDSFIGWEGETFQGQKTFSSGGWIEQLSWHPRAYLYHNFLTPAEADHLIELVRVARVVASLWSWLHSGCCVAAPASQGGCCVAPCSLLTTAAPRAVQARPHIRKSEVRRHRTGAGHAPAAVTRHVAARVSGRRSGCWLACTPA